VTRKEKIDALIDAMGVDPDEKVAMTFAGRLPAIETGLLAPVIEPDTIDKQGYIHVLVFLDGTVSEVVERLNDLRNRGFTDVSIRESSRVRYVLDRRPVFA